MGTTSGHDPVTALALAAGAGDRAALEEFVRTTQRDVWRFVAHLAGVGGADDLTQETYLRALSALPRFAAQSTARTWLFSIARHTVADHLRATRRRPRVLGTDDWVPLADERLADRRRESAGFEDLVETGLLLDTLDQDRREALVLTQILGLSYEEVAQICGCPVGTVRSRIARARDDLMRAHGATETGSG